MELGQLTGYKIASHKNFLTIFVSFLIKLLLVSEASRAHVKETRLGKLEGLTKVARGGKPFHAYYGIPYAKAPVGNLRFEPPIQAELWSGILNATKSPPICPQISDHTTEYSGQEDCLYLNVYTPMEAKPGSNIPVIFYIFGGLFMRGNPLHEGPEFIMNKNIIIVMANYRVGVLGFLSTGDTAIAGNMALKDQTLAMKWTKTNIYDFGGDPDRITIHGHSSGSSCVHLHTMSPLSHDYFNQAIMESGLALNPQSFMDADTARGSARVFAEHLNCPIDSSDSLKKCLQNKEAKELVLVTQRLTLWKNKTQPTFLPVIEDKNVECAFLNENPLFASYLSKTKPWLLGMTSNEAGTFVSSYFDTERSLPDMDFKLFFPVLTSYIKITKPNYLNFVSLKMKIKFFGEQKVRYSTDIADIALSKMMTGILYGYQFLMVLQKYKAVKYAYVYDYRCVGGYTYSKGRGGRYLGAGHTDELVLIFNRTSDPGIKEEDLLFGDEIITRLVNFAHSGDPNVPLQINTSMLGVWRPVSTPRLEFLRINRNGRMEKDYLLEEYSFWKKIPVLSKYL